MGSDGIFSASKSVFNRLSMSPPLVIIEPGAWGQSKLMPSSATVLDVSETSGAKVNAPTFLSTESSFVALFGWSHVAYSLSGKFAQSI